MATTEKKVSKDRQIFNVRSIREKKYVTLDLGEEYNNLIGRIEAKCNMFVYGASGGGKSVFVLRFANYFAENIGKALYNSHEEGVNQTIKDRIEQFKIGSQKLYFGNKLSFEVMMQKIKRNHYHLVVIDSVQYMQFTYAQLKEMRSVFSKRKIVLVMVSFGNTENNPDKAKDHLHASDVKIYIRKGRASIVSRYLQAPVLHQLFKKAKLQGELYA